MGAIDSSQQFLLENFLNFWTDCSFLGATNAYKAQNNNNSLRRAPLQLDPALVRPIVILDSLASSTQ